MHYTNDFTFDMKLTYFMCTSTFPGKFMFGKIGKTLIDILAIGTPFINQKCCGVGMPSVSHKNSAFSPWLTTTDSNSIFTLQNGFAGKWQQQCLRFNEYQISCHNCVVFTSRQWLLDCLNITKGSSSPNPLSFTSDCWSKNLILLVMYWIIFFCESAIYLHSTLRVKDLLIGTLVSSLIPLHSYFPASSYWTLAITSSRPYPSCLILLVMLPSTRRHIVRGVGLKHQHMYITMLENKPCIRRYW